MQQFTDAKACKLSVPGFHTVDTTLYLRITDRSKYWVQRITIKGKRHDLGLGAFPVVSVDEARETAFQNRRRVRAGGDPLAEKRKALKPDFEAAATAALNSLGPTWRNSMTEKEWRRCMNTYVLPRIGHKRIDLIDRADLLDILVPLWTDKNATARRLRGWIKAVFSWAQAFGHIETNLAGDAISAALPKQAGKTKHHRALNHAEVRDALNQTDKAGVLQDKSGLVFPSPRNNGRPLTNATMMVFLRRAGLADRATVHGLRSSFRDWCADTGKPREIAEAALAHVVKGTEGAYFRSDLFERRRALMSQWADYLTGRRADVVKLHG